MNGLIVRDLVQWMNEWAPPDLAEKWDRVGLQCGSGESPVTGVVTALTLSPGVVKMAVAESAQLIVTHHPLIFDPLMAISPHSRVGSLLYKLIQNDLALLVAHTNLDKADGGVNDGLAQRLQLTDTAVLMPDKSRGDATYKLVTFVPEEAEMDVRNALAEAGAGVIGSYTHCAFASEGVGSFRPMEGADPYSGVVGQLARVKEMRLETVVRRRDLRNVLNSLDQAHPYEEVAVDVYPLEDPGTAHVGLGRIGNLDTGMSGENFVKHVQHSLGIPSCRVAGNLNRTVRRVAVVGGSGGGFVQQAYEAGADALVTGDVRYHDADEASYLDILLIDAGHFGTEKHAPYDMANYFRQKAQEVNAPLDVKVYDESDVFILGG